MVIKDRLGGLVSIVGTFNQEKALASRGLLRDSENRWIVCSSIWESVRVPMLLWRRSPSVEMKYRRPIFQHTTH